MSMHPVQKAGWFRRNSWRFVVAADSCVAGALVAFTVATMLEIEGPRKEAVDPVFAAAMGFFGGFGAGLMLSPWFGRVGRTGWLYAVAASLAAPVLAGAVAGSLLFPGPGTLLGARMTLWTYWFPQSIAVWALCIVIIHLHIRRIRPQIS